MGHATIGLFLGLDGNSTGGIAATATAVEFKLRAIHQERTEIRVDRGNCTGRDTTSFPFPLERDQRQRKESHSRLLVYHWYCHAVFVFLDRRNRTGTQVLIIKTMPTKDCVFCTRADVPGIVFMVKRTCVTKGKFGFY